MSIPADLIERARAMPIESTVAHLRLKRHGRELVGPCPVCGGTDRHSVHIRKGIFNCRGCKAAGDVIALAQHVYGVDFVGAVELLTGNRVTPPPRRAPPPAARKTDGDEARNLAHAAVTWDAAMSIGSPEGKPGLDYLARRGIVLDETTPDFAGLRFHPRCPWQRDTTPCVLARFTTVITNEPRGIWRRPIDGRKPMSLGSHGGCVIRLWPDEYVAEGLVIGEGIETVLSASTRIEHHGTLLQPAWACGVAGTLENFPVLAGIEALTILADPDANGRGQDAARICAERWADAGREVTVLTPRTLGVDFNDLIRARP